MQVGISGLGSMSSLGRLLKLALKIYGEVEFWEMPPNSLPSLAHLDLEGSIPSITDFLSRIRPSHLLAITITSTSGSDDDVYDLVELACDFTSLETFEMHGRYPEGIQWEGIIGPLLSCREIQDVYIGPSVPMDDLKLRLMAEAWPKLVSLRLPQRDWTVPSVTLLGLQVLPPTMQDLELLVDSRLYEGQIFQVQLPNLRQVHLVGHIDPKYFESIVVVVRYTWPSVIRAKANEQSSWDSVWRKVFGVAGRQPWKAMGYDSEGSH